MIQSLLGVMMARKIFLFFTLLSIFVGSAQAESTCLSYLRQLLGKANLAITEAQEEQTLLGRVLPPTLAALKGYLKLNTYPLVSGPIKAIRLTHQTVTRDGVRYVYRVPLKILKEDTFYPFGSLLLYWFYFNNRPFKTVAYYEQAQKNLPPLDPQKDLVVFVNAFSPDAPGMLYDHAKTMYAALFKNFARAKYLEALSGEELIQKLEQLKKEEGPLAHLTIDTHGKPGRIEILKEKITADSPLWQDPRLKNLFKPNASIVFNSCLTGSGEQGTVLSREVGRNLLPEGGVIVSSPRILVSRTLDYSAHSRWSDFYMNGKYLAADILLLPFKDIIYVYASKSSLSRNKLKIIAVP